MKKGRDSQNQSDPTAARCSLCGCENGDRIQGLVNANRGYS